ncbi:MAG: YjjW family glycine radical enzyme activase [Filifactor alocis]|nr:YjjW family glycine radical enzyme activase [Filifactor alocis]
MNKLQVNKIIPFSSVDGPGNRMAIFLQGCNFNCLYCHNPETINLCNHCGICVDHCPSKALSLNEGTVTYDPALCIDCDTCIKICPHNSSPKVLSLSCEDVLRQIGDYIHFLSGITVSGGECSLQHRALTELFRGVKQRFPKLSRFIDTNGGIPLYTSSMVDFVSSFDKAMLDIKSWESRSHLLLTGRDNIIVRKNLDFLLEKNKLFEIRTVIVPELEEHRRLVADISSHVAKKDPKIRYKLIRYRQMGVREELLRSYSPSEKYMEELSQIAKQNGLIDILIV